MPYPHKHKTVTDRLPPHSEEAGRGVLACCMLDPQRCVPEMVARFGDLTGVFYDLRNQVIAQAIVKVFEATGKLDQILLYQNLKDSGDLEMAGGIASLTKLPDEAPSAEQVGDYLDILQSKLRLRKLLAVCTEASGKVYECNGQSDELIDAVERDVLAIRQFGSRVEQRTMKQVVIEAVGRFEAAMANQGGMDGLATGLVDWDRLTGGLHKTELTVVGGFPGTGKTALAMNVAQHVAVELGKPVGVFSLEMSAELLATRMLCSSARVDLKRARTGQFTEGDMTSLAVAATKLSKAQIHWEDESDISLVTLRAKARRMKQQHKVELIVVDYIQLVDGGGGSKDENEEKQISNVSRTLKAIAMELDTPVLALSQLNDDGKLRGSRAIGHHADNVCRIRALKESDGNRKGDEFDRIGDEAVAVDLLVVKQRNGPTGKVPLTFLKRFVRFENAARKQDEGT